MTESKPNLSRCPTCGKERLRRQILDIEVDDGQCVARNIEVDVCEACGDRLFDAEAVRRMEQACPLRKKRSRTHA